VAKPKFKDYLQIIDFQCKKYAQKDLYIFLSDGEEKIDRISYADTLSEIHTIAANLKTFIGRNDRILILCPPGIEFNISFLGCLFAGAIPVPLYPPDTRSFDRVINIVNDCSAKAAIANHETIQKIEQNKATDTGSYISKALSNVKLLDSHEIRQGKKSFIAEPVSPTDIAYLQYTSGSTSKPKGVMVTHRNLVYNTDYITRYFQHTEEVYIVSWIPPFHDMGLIKDIIATIYSGSVLVFMSPYSFLRKPIRWLKAITKYGKLGPIIAGGPNFAYDLCTKAIDPEQLNDVDLSNWKIAFNGSEPVRPSTLEAFYEMYKVCGFRKKALEPVYGLAEGTLMVGGPLLGNEPVIRNLDKNDFKSNKITFSENSSDSSISIPCCGRIIVEQETLIVNPDTMSECAEDEIGEIWIKGPSVTAGYFHNKEETEKTFHAYLADSRGPYLRTGDLGFLWGKEIYITGRLKDLIIINGYNHYPQDLELTACSAHEALRVNGGIAFSVEEDEKEKLVLVCEVKRSALKNVDPEDIKSNIKQAIFQVHGIQVYQTVLVASSSIPKTSSGKLQRKLCKKQYLEKTLKQIEFEKDKKY
jgi:acyl-CoA synthetase (AMP-forming)/AMP-acid ligase II